MTSRTERTSSRVSDMADLGFVFSRYHDAALDRATWHFFSEIPTIFVTSVVAFSYRRTILLS